VWSRPLSLPGIRAADERHRVTTFELCFDLVFVFAVTQVTRFMADAHSGVGVVGGLLLLGLLWWVWSGYTWLGNQARADEGLVRASMALAMTAISSSRSRSRRRGRTSAAGSTGRWCWWPPTTPSASSTSRSTPPQPIAS